MGKPAQVEPARGHRCGFTGTGAAPVLAQVARELGILTVGVVTKPFNFEGKRRMTLAEGGITDLKKYVDTLIVIPNQNLFRVANEQTTFADAFSMADQVLYSGVACITDLMVKEGLINLDFADVRSVMRDGGKAMMGTGEAKGDNRAVEAAESAIANPLLDDVSMMGARGALVSISGGRDLRLYEVDEAANRIREEVDSDANIIVGATFDDALDGTMRVSVVATGVDVEVIQNQQPTSNIQMPTKDVNININAAFDNIPQNIRQYVEKYPEQTTSSPAQNNAGQTLFTAPIEENDISQNAQAAQATQPIQPTQMKQATQAPHYMQQNNGNDVAVKRVEMDKSQFAAASKSVQPHIVQEEAQAPKRNAPFIPAPTMRPHGNKITAAAQQRSPVTAPNPHSEEAVSPVEQEKRRIGFFDRISELNRQKKENKAALEAQQTAAMDHAKMQKLAEHHSKVTQDAEQMRHFLEQKHKEKMQAQAQRSNAVMPNPSYGHEAVARQLETLEQEEDIPAFLRKR